MEVAVRNVCANHRGEAVFKEIAFRVLYELIHHMSTRYSQKLLQRTDPQYRVRTSTDSASLEMGTHVSER